MEDQHVLTVNGHIIGDQIGVYVTAQWYIKNAVFLQHQVSEGLLHLTVGKKAIV